MKNMKKMYKKPIIDKVQIEPTSIICLSEGDPMSGEGGEGGNTGDAPLRVF